MHQNRGLKYSRVQLPPLAWLTVLPGCIPLPLYPTEQPQVYDPAVFMHFPPLRSSSQKLPVLHSSTSEETPDTANLTKLVHTNGHKINLVEGVL